jgi:hypothetical protein
MRKPDVQASLRALDTVGTTGVEVLDCRRLFLYLSNWAARKFRLSDDDGRQ